MSDDMLFGIVIGFYIGFGFFWLVGHLYKIGILKEWGEDDVQE